MKNPKISIVTPSYNQGDFIGDAIQSLLDQGYENFEHIIIDAVSTDNTHEVVSRYPHVTFISEPDEGQSDALNKGFKRATGDIVGWLNADDFYMPDTFNKVLKVLEDPKVDAVYSNVRFIDGEGNYTRDLIEHKVVKWLAWFYCYIPSTTFFFKREIMDDGPFIDKDFHISMDMELFARLLHKGYKFQYVNDFFASFRWHGGNKSIESKEVEDIRMKEGVTILNRYSPLNLSMSKFNLSMYGKVQAASKVFRAMAKTQNYKYKLKDWAR
ncbi:MAG: glycosyltransferase family 2 protein [Bacteroidota bacterium]